jgi:hypothetical protein
MGTNKYSKSIQLVMNQSKQPQRLQQAKKEARDAAQEKRKRASSKIEQMETRAEYYRTGAQYYSELWKQQQLIHSKKKKQTLAETSFDYFWKNWKRMQKAITNRTEKFIPYEKEAMKALEEAEKAKKAFYNTKKQSEIKSWHTKKAYLNWLEAYINYLRAEGNFLFEAEKAGKDEKELAKWRRQIADKEFKECLQTQQRIKKELGIN